MFRPPLMFSKESKAERAQRLYNDAVRSAKHQERLISRANGYAVSPPRTTTREESMSPPRNPPKARTKAKAQRSSMGMGTNAKAGPSRGDLDNPIDLGDDDDDDDMDEGDGNGDGAGGGYSWMGGHGRAAQAERDRQEEAERMAWLEEEERAALGGDPFGSYGMGTFDFNPTDDIRIPQRHRPPHHPAFSISTSGNVNMSFSASFSSSFHSHSHSNSASFSFSHGFPHPHTHHHFHHHHHRHHPFDPLSSHRGHHHHHHPNLESMTDAEYTAFIRDGMDRDRHRQEQADREQARREKVAREWEEERRRVKQEEREEKRRRKREKERRSKHHDLDEEEEVKDGEGVMMTMTMEEVKAEERARYLRRWEALGVVVGGVGGGKNGANPTVPSGVDKDQAKGKDGGDKDQEDKEEIMEVALDFNSIPWPVYSSSSLAAAQASSFGKRKLPTRNQITIDHLDKAHIRTFLQDLARNSPGAKLSQDDEKKTLREAIRIFHPDRFFSRFLDKVRESDRELVKEGVERCSRVINDLAAELAGR